MVRTLRRGLGAGALVTGVVVGSLVGGTVGAIVGVLVTMIGFQLLTRGVEGAPYIVAGVSATVGIVFVAWRHHLTWTDIGLGRASWVTGLLWSLGIVLVVGAIVGTAGSIPRLHHLFADQRLTHVSGAVTARRALLDIPFGTVLIEEFAFRGVMLALVTSLTGTAWAVVITSALFGLWHIGPALEMHDAHQATTGASWSTVAGTVVVTGVSGVGFALLRLYTGSLFPPSALHWAGNGTGVVVAWFVHRLTPMIEDLRDEDTTA
ncbi:MAG TPA: type II CAAX endopeptidase family protein [Candidatus Angelobacter sp.]|nr:type II CAAX endopeptidase family protein [Candidatus Angelobacter sp.]